MSVLQSLTSPFRHAARGYYKLSSFISVYGFWGAVNRIWNNVFLVEKVHYMVKDLCTPEEKIIAKVPLDIIPYTNLDFDHWDGIQAILNLRGDYGITQFRERLARGDVFFPAYSDGKFAAFVWLECPPVKDVGYPLPMDEGYTHDAWTFDEFRGKGIFPVIQQAIFDYVRQNRPEIRKLITHVATWNKASTSGDTRAGYVIVRKDLSVVILGFHRKFPLR
jgi:hypothetical protein